MADTHNGPPLIEAEDECRVLLEHLTDVVFFIRVSDGRIFVANRAAEKLYGRSTSELLGMRIYDLVATIDGAPIEPVDATRDGQITAEGVRFEATHANVDGTEIPVEVSARIVSVSGERTIIAIIRDVTERKRAERSLVRAYDELEQVFDTAADGMRVVDREFRVIRVNSTMLGMTGLTREEVLGELCHETFAGTACHTDECPLVRVLAGEGRTTAEVEKVRPNGETVTCILTVQPLILDGEIAGIVESFRDITERKRAEELAEHLATHDTLTGLPNRLLFTDRLEVALARARREHTRPALLFCDLDDFKEVNDLHGHAAGDEVLCAVARAVSSVVRESDTVARLGGDEFVVLLADVADEDDARAVVGKIAGALGAVSLGNGTALDVTVSVGVAVYEAGDDADSLMRRADSAMYEMKRSSGGYGAVTD